LIVIRKLIILFNSFFSQSLFLYCVYILILGSITILAFINNENYVFAHINETSKLQELVNNNDGIKIQLAYEPEKPIIDTFTKLYFSVQDLEGNHIKDFNSSVTVTNGQRLFKFQNITVVDGDFSVEYIFPDDGTHQVITRIDTKTNIIPASFSVFVPHQSPPSVLNPFPLPPYGKYSLSIIVSIILSIIIPIIAVISLIIVIKKR
jgi:hypothetical protein